MVVEHGVPSICSMHSANHQPGIYPLIIIVQKKALFKITLNPASLLSCMSAGAETNWLLSNTPRSSLEQHCIIHH